MSLDQQESEAIAELARRFELGAVERVEPLQVGHINSSFRVRLAGPRELVFVQRINSHVFRRPDRVMRNVRLVVDHLRAGPLGVLELLRDPHGDPSFVDVEGETWRAFNYLEHATLGRTPQTLDQIRAASRAFGAFHRGVADLDAERLETTIEHFHDTPHRYLSLDRVLAQDPVGRAAHCRAEIERCQGARPLAPAITGRLESGDLPLRCVHNDAKFSNVLLAPTTHEPLCVVDLDTVMPGSPLFDLGHMIRSMSHAFEEDEADLAAVAIDEERYGAILDGYFSAADDLLTPLERELIVTGAQVMVLQEAVRFLTDHLDGDRYFRIRHEGQNLERCRMHLALLDALAAAAPRLLELGEA